MTLRALSVALAVVVAACGSERRSPSETSSPDAGVADAALADVAASEGGATDARAPIDELCLTHPQEGTLVDRTHKAGSAPVPTGGAIAPAKYLLTANNAYTTNPIVLVYRLAETLVIADGRMDSTSMSDGDATEYRSRSTFTTNAAQITMTNVCTAPAPDGGARAATRTLGYSATANELRLYGGSGTSIDELVYTKQ